MNEVLEPITFVLAYPTVYEVSTIFLSLYNWEIVTVSCATKSRSHGSACYLLRERQRDVRTQVKYKMQ
jgi:hypothetical protein